MLTYDTIVKDGKVLTILNSDEDDRCFIKFEKFIATDPIIVESILEVKFDEIFIKKSNTLPSCLTLKVIEFFMKTGELAPFIVWKEENGF